MPSVASTSACQRPGRAVKMGFAVIIAPSQPSTHCIHVKKGEG